MPRARKPVVDAVPRKRLALLCLAGWLLPGAAHLLLGRRKGWVFLVALTLMYVLGLMLEGRLYAFETTQPLNWIYAIGGHALGTHYFVARALGYGTGRVEAVTFEYGDTYLVTAGLLNILVIFDALDVAVGRK
jgi:hypothetical protein